MVGSQGATAFDRQGKPDTRILGAEIPGQTLQGAAYVRTVTGGYEDRPQKSEITKPGQSVTEGGLIKVPRGDFKGLEDALKRNPSFRVGQLSPGQADSGENCLRPAAASFDKGLKSGQGANTNPFPHHSPHVVFCRNLSI